jgi:2-oxoglutarate ferredoxin oxidoreductase subunit beta
VILFNNHIYGMTGGQASPLTPLTKKATTAPYGNIDRPFDPCQLAIAAGATYVARSTAFHVQHLTSMIEQSFDNKGFSLVEAITQCPVAYGRKNKMGDAADMLKWMSQTATMMPAFEKMTPEQRQERFPIGVLHQASLSEYTSDYQKVIECAGGAE